MSVTARSCNREPLKVWTAVGWQLEKGEWCDGDVVGDGVVGDGEGNAGRWGLCMIDDDDP